jgi:hypothetical protein
MKLTTEQKNSIKNQLLTTVKNPETRSRIIAIAYGYANENGEDGDLESMVSYLMNKENANKIDELFDQYAMSMEYASEVEQASKKEKE